MSVHQLPDGRWVVQYKAEGKLKREYFGHGPEAEKLARERNDALPLRSWKRRTPEPGGYGSPTSLKPTLTRWPRICKRTAAGT